jgi:hypothetical protein
VRAKTARHSAAFAEALDLMHWRCNLARPINPLTFEQYQALATGIPKYCPKASFTNASQTLTASQVVKLITSIISASSAVATAKTELTNARLAEQKVVAQNGAIVKAVRANIAAMFSDNATILAAFSIPPKKVRQPRTAAVILAAAAKAKSTREARGTTSKKQKATISGNVTGVTVTPITIPSAAPAANPPAALAPATAPSALAPIVTKPVASAPATAPVTVLTPQVTSTVSSPVTPVSNGVVLPVAGAATSA